MKPIHVEIAAALAGLVLITALIALTRPSRISSLVAPGATLQTLAREFKFTEGPTSDKDGNVYFTDQPNDRIMKWGVDGKLSTLLQPSGRANGMFFDTKGNLIACAEENNELWSIANDGTHKVLANEFGGKPLNGPNDLWIHPSGAIYFTDPFYKRSWSRHTNAPQPSQQVYRLAPDYKTLMLMTDDLVQPNGITGTQDGKRLFVADSGAHRTYVYDIAADGFLTGKKLFSEMGSDGMTLDAKGNLFITGRGVFVFNKNGKQIGHLDVPERKTANVSFGGKDHRTLFITASKGLYAIRMKHPGANPAK